MEKNKPYKRRNIYIKKDFQTSFTIKFLALVAVEAILAVGLFVYLSKGTITAGYSANSEIIITKTADYFLPAIMLSNLIILVLTAGAGITVLLFTSHKLAGPLFRFEKSLEEIGRGNLTHRFTLRQNDQITEMGQRLNAFTAEMDSGVAALKAGLDELAENFKDTQASAGSNVTDKELENKMQQALKKLQELKRIAGYYKTSGRERRTL